MLVVMTMRSPHRASLSVMSKNQTVGFFSIWRGFHAKKLRGDCNSTIRRTANRDVIQILTSLFDKTCNARVQILSDSGSLDSYVCDPIGGRLSGR